MTIRPATLDDLEACLALDHSYLTERVWQIDARSIPEQIFVAHVLQREVQVPLVEELASDARMDEEIVSLPVV